MYRKENFVHKKHSNKRIHKINVFMQILSFLKRIKKIVALSRTDIQTTYYIKKSFSYSESK